MARKTTIRLLLVVILLLAGYDVYAMLQGYENTITYLVRELSADYPAIPWGVGLLLGYWLGRAKSGKPADTEN